ncbi:MAG TPA: type II toxin-antitoxin system VapC family toxin [Propionibacterium sp.]|jgi:PIN domain nuclease of toxin-antitoxin system|nr:type II toxin-antitoxin system VapC family toxin [Propionibacterium sp.]
MTALLDTHVVLWLLEDSPRLGGRTRDWLQRQPRVFMSSASLWEIAIKQELGKITAPVDLPDLVERSGLEWLSVTPIHTWNVRNVSGLPHRDPFDRLLLAQAHQESLTLVTADSLLLAADVVPPVSRWDARE